MSTIDHGCAAELPPTPADKAERALSNDHEFRALLDAMDRYEHVGVEVVDGDSYLIIGNFMFVAGNDVTIEVTTEGWSTVLREPIGDKSVMVWCNYHWTSEKFEARLKPKVLELLTECYQFVEDNEQRARINAENLRRSKEREEDDFISAVLGDPS